MKKMTISLPVLIFALASTSVLAAGVKFSDCLDEMAENCTRKEDHKNQKIIGNADNGRIFGTIFSGTVAVFICCFICSFCSVKLKHKYLVKNVQKTENQPNDDAQSISSGSISDGSSQKKSSPSLKKSSPIESES